MAECVLDATRWIGQDWNPGPLKPRNTGLNRFLIPLLQFATLQKKIF